MDRPGYGAEHAAVRPEGQSGKKKSLIVIRQGYVFLQPTIASMFQGEEDVQVIIDRRFHDRRRETIPVSEDRRSRGADRRTSSPMIEVLINIDA